MTLTNQNKIQITEQVIVDSKVEIPLEKALWFWYIDGRRTIENVRLSYEGFQAFKAGGIKFYQVALDIEWSRGKGLATLMALQKRIQGPWYLTPKKIYLTNEEEPTWMLLLGGDLKALR